MRSAEGPLLFTSGCRHQALRPPFTVFSFFFPRVAAGCSMCHLSAGSDMQGWWWTWLQCLALHSKLWAICYWHFHRSIRNRGHMNKLLYCTLCCHHSWGFCFFDQEGKMFLQNWDCNSRFKPPNVYKGSSKKDTKIEGQQGLLNSC